MYTIVTDSSCDLPSSLLRSWGVKCANLNFIFDDSPEVYDNDNERMVIPIKGIEIEAFRKGFCDIKPYLRSMDSMTDEEAKELTAADRTKYPNFDDPSACEDFRKSWGIWAQYCTVPIDWLHKHHFDYRGLIKRGLAIKVTDNNNPYIKKESEM